MFEESEVVVDGITSPNKYLIIYNKPNTTLFAVRWKHGGELPAELNGCLWTSRKDVVTAITRWTEKSKTPAKKRGAA